MSVAFAIYSALAMYSLNTYGKSKSFSFAASIIYLVIMVSLMVWGLVIITGE
jgi:hypothetical protein